MPKTDIRIYQEEPGECPLIEWLTGLDKKAVTKCQAFIERLTDMGHELRRPTCDTLRDGIHELRPSLRGVQHRILYAFVGQQIVLLTHGLTKEGKVPDAEIERAIEYKERYEKNPELHTYEVED